MYSLLLVTTLIGATDPRPALQIVGLDWVDDRRDCLPWSERRLHATPCVRYHRVPFRARTFADLGFIARGFADYSLVKGEGDLELTKQFDIFIPAPLSKDEQELSFRIHEINDGHCWELGRNVCSLLHQLYGNKPRDFAPPAFGAGIQGLFLLARSKFHESDPAATGVFFYARNNLQVRGRVRLDNLAAIVAALESLGHDASIAGEVGVAWEFSAEDRRLLGWKWDPRTPLQRDCDSYAERVKQVPLDGEVLAPPCGSVFPPETAEIVVEGIILREDVVRVTAAGTDGRRHAATLEDGRFRAVVPLRHGENTVTVRGYIARDYDDQLSPAVRHVLIYVREPPKEPRP